MTLPSATCSSTVFTLLVSAYSVHAATVTGSVELTGAAVKDLSGAVVWLEPLDAHQATPPRHERMIQKNKTFTPHVLPISLGSSVEFPNLDPIFHNAFSNFNGQIFDLALYPPGKSRTVTFRRPGVVRIFCNIHPTMSAVIVVVDTPYYAVSDRSGRFTLPDVPPGRYRENVFFERATPETLASLTKELDLKGASEVLPPIRISETGYLPTPHANKHGQPYPPESESPYTVH
jgi:plastocyanin